MSCGMKAIGRYPDGIMVFWCGSGIPKPSNNKTTRPRSRGGRIELPEPGRVSPAFHDSSEGAKTK